MDLLFCSGFRSFLELTVCRAHTYPVYSRNNKGIISVMSAAGGNVSSLANQKKSDVAEKADLAKFLSETEEMLLDVERHI